MASKPGKTPGEHAQTRMTVATTKSKIVSTISVGVRVVYVVPCNLVLHEHELHRHRRPGRA